MTPTKQPPGTFVRTSVTVKATREHAFTVFTEHFDTWWPRSHYNGTGELAQVVLEPKAGGRWYARGTDGFLGDWGTVLTWDPPARLVLAWQLDAEFDYNPHLVTEIEVTFTELGPHLTLVELEHRNLDRFGSATNKMRSSFGSDNGWTGILRIFAERAKATDIDHGQPAVRGGLMDG